MAATESEHQQYCCNAVNPITRKSIVFTGLVVDAPLDEEFLRIKTRELVTAWPVLGGRLIRTVS
jgi:hypothetical protein